MQKNGSSKLEKETHYLPTEAARITGIDRKTIRTWIRLGRIERDLFGRVSMHDLEVIKNRPRRGRPHAKKVRPELSSPERIGDHIRKHPKGMNFLRSIFFHARAKEKLGPVLDLLFSLR